MDEKSTFFYLIIFFDLCYNRFMKEKSSKTIIARRVTLSYTTSIVLYILSCSRKNE